MYSQTKIRSDGEKICVEMNIMMISYDSFIYLYGRFIEHGSNVDCGLQPPKCQVRASLIGFEPLIRKSGSGPGIGGLDTFAMTIHVFLPSSPIGHLLHDPPFGAFRVRNVVRHCKETHSAVQFPHNPL